MATAVKRESHTAVKPESGAVRLAPEAEYEPPRPYAVEPAKSGTSRCALCGQYILAGHLRFGTLINPFGRATGTMKWRHYGCITERVAANALEALQGDVSKISGFSRLPPAEQQKLATLIRERGSVEKPRRGAAPGPALDEVAMGPVQTVKRPGRGRPRKPQKEEEAGAGAELEEEGGEEEEPPRKARAPALRLMTKKRPRAADRERPPLTVEEEYAAGYPSPPDLEPPKLARRVIMIKGGARTAPPAQAAMSALRGEPPELARRHRGLAPVNPDTGAIDWAAMRRHQAEVGKRRGGSRAAGGGLPYASVPESSLLPAPGKESTATPYAGATVNIGGPGGAPLPRGAADALQGFSIVITGEHPTERGALSDFIERHGGTVRNSVTSRTTHLLAGDSMCGPKKMEQAEQMGIPIISEPQLLDFVRRSAGSAAARMAG